MHCHIEEFERGGVIRVFADGKQFGEPYEYAFPFRHVEGGIEIVGANARIPTKQECRAMLMAAAERGWSVWAKRGRRMRQWHWERVRQMWG